MLALEDDGFAKGGPAMPVPILENRLKKLLESNHLVLCMRIN